MTSVEFGAVMFGVCLLLIALRMPVAVAMFVAGGFGFASLGILIPPSVILVIYAVITEQSIGKLFLAAVVPGIIATVGYSVAIAAYVRLKPEAGPAVAAVPIRQRIRSLGMVWPVALIFVSVIGGIYFGLFTPTEGGAIGAAATGLFAIASGRLSWAAFASCLLETAKATGMIFLILVSAQILNSFLALSQVTTELANALAGSGLSPILILVGILLIYLVLGCVMDSLAMILLTVPVFFPLLTGLDFGYTEEQIAIWFGVLALFAVEIGLITPPIGLNVYVINSLDGETPLGESFRGVVPCLLSGLVVLALILFIPAICLWLPGLQ